MKKRFIHPITICFILVLGFFLACDNGTGNNEIPNEVLDSRPIVCFGDSLTNGYGASEGQTYPYFLQGKVRVPVINAGVDGETSADGLMRINGDVLANDPQLVIIGFGGNDLFQGLTIAETEKNLREMIERIDNGTRKIYISDWVPVSTADNASLIIINALRFINRVPILTLGELNNFISEYRNMLISLSAIPNIEIILNIFQGIYDVPELMNDPLHPNSQGYEIMADNIFTVIEPYLRVNNLLR